MGVGGSRTYYRRRKHPPRRVRIPSIVPTNEEETGVEANLGLNLQTYDNVNDNDKMVMDLEISPESLELGLWPATKIVEHNAGRCN